MMGEQNFGNVFEPIALSAYEKTAEYYKFENSEQLVDYIITGLTILENPPTRSECGAFIAYVAKHIITNILKDFPTDKEIDQENLTNIIAKVANLGLEYYLSHGHIIAEQEGTKLSAGTITITGFHYDTMTIQFLHSIGYSILLTHPAAEPITEEPILKELITEEPCLAETPSTGVTVVAETPSTGVTVVAETPSTEEPCLAETPSTGVTVVE
jgi:hypothetical protein